MGNSGAIVRADRMKKVYLRNPSSSKHRPVKVGPRFAGGAAGDIHRLPEIPGQVLKLYKTASDRDLYAPKLEAMLERPPKLSSSKSQDKNFQQLAWPISIAETGKRKFLGFTMPEIDFDRSVSLERMLQKRIRQVSGLPDFYGYRFLAAYNLAVSVAALHKNGHYIIDLKPVNCRLQPNKMLISILDCDGFSVNGGRGKRFHANQFTPEYIAPEAFQKKPDELGEKQDLFALAVIIFRLLNNGLHPFQARLPKGVNGGTIQEMINADYYAYGLKKSSKCSAARQSVHESFPDNLRKMFDQAFERTTRPKAAKWRDVLKEYADPSSGKLIRCKMNPEVHAYFDNDKGCGWCVLEGANQQPTRTKPKPRKKRAASPLPPSKAISLASLSRMQGRIPLIFTILAAVFLAGISLQAPMSLTPEKSRPPPSPRDKPSMHDEMPAIPSEKISEMNGLGFITSNANLRSGAGVNFSVILTLPQGTEVQIRGKVEGRNWYLIKLTSKSDQKNINLKGYVDGKLLAHLK